MKTLDTADAVGEIRMMAKKPSEEPTRPPGRPRLDPADDTAKFTLRLPAATLAAIRELLAEGQDVGAWIRAAISRELARARKK